MRDPLSKKKNRIQEKQILEKKHRNFSRIKEVSKEEKRIEGEVSNQVFDTALLAAS